MRHKQAGWVLAWLLSACTIKAVPSGGGASSEQIDAPEPAVCDMGNVTLDDGGCQAPGIPADGCAEGFVHDGVAGCDALLPEAPCAKGTFAIPGELICHSVADCGSGTWGNIPTLADTAFVDSVYTGGSSDGSKLRPYNTVMAAIHAATHGSLIAIAAGRYAEAVVIQGKAVDLAGRCPSMVEIVGDTSSPYGVASMLILAGAGGSKLSGMAITGASTGLLVSGSLDVVAERLWIYDNQERGVAVQDALGPANLLLRDCLIEGTLGSGIVGFGAGISVERSVVRNNIPPASSKAGSGVSAHREPTSGRASELHVRSSVIAGNRFTGLIVVGSALTMQGSVVMDTLAKTDGKFGRGIVVHGTSATADLQGLLLQNNHQTSIHVVAAQVDMRSITIRNTLGDAEGRGRGIDISHSVDGEPAFVRVRSSVVGGSREVGVAVIASDAEMDSVLVVDTTPDLRALRGHGVQLRRGAEIDMSASLMLRSSLIRGSNEAGVAVLGAQLTLDNTIVTETASSGLYGDGLFVVRFGADASAVVQGNRFGQNARAGIANFGSLVSPLRSASAVAANAGVTANAPITAIAVATTNPFASPANPPTGLRSRPAWATNLPMLRFSGGLSRVKKKSLWDSTSFTFGIENATALLAAARGTQTRCLILLRRWVAPRGSQSKPEGSSCG